MKYRFRVCNELNCIDTFIVASQNDTYLIAQYSSVSLQAHTHTHTKFEPMFMTWCEKPNGSMSTPMSFDVF